MRPTPPSCNLVLVDLACLATHYANAVVEAATSAFGAYGISLDRDLAALALGHAAPLAVGRVHGEAALSRKISEERLQDIAQAFEKEARRYFKFGPIFCAEPSIKRVMNDLQMRGVGTALVSDFDSETVAIVLDRIGLDATEMFDVVFPAHSGGEPMQKAGQLKRVMALLGARDARQVTFLGAATSDVAAGRQANCGKVMLLGEGPRSGNKAQEQLEPDGFLNSCSELLVHLFEEGPMASE